jgi:hypothetical protein
MMKNKDALTGLKIARVTLKNLRTKPLEATLAEYREMRAIRSAEKTGRGHFTELRKSLEFSLPRLQWALGFINNELALLPEKQQIQACEEIVKMKGIPIHMKSVFYHRLVALYSGKNETDKAYAALRELEIMMDDARLFK